LQERQSASADSAAPASRCCAPRRVSDRNGATRGAEGEAMRERVRRTGVVVERPPRSSRNTM